MKKINYTIVPILEYKDNSLLAGEEIESLYNSLFFLSAKGMGVLIPTGKEIIKRGKACKEVRSFSLVGLPKVIVKNNGKFALLCNFLDKNDKEYQKICYFEQSFFPEFIMPILRYHNKFLLEQELVNFFNKLIVRDKKYFELKKKINAASFNRTLSVREQKYQNAASFRDEEQKNSEELQKYLQPKVERFLKKIPGITMEGDWMEYAKKEKPVIFKSFKKTNPV